MRTMKHLALAAAAAAALALAGCGGGSGGPPSAAKDDETPTLAGKYLLDGATIAGLDVEDTTIEVASSAQETIEGVGTVECVSDDGCSGTVADGTLTITGNLKIVSVGSDLDDATITAIAAAAKDMGPAPGAGCRDAADAADGGCV